MPSTSEEKRQALDRAQQLLLKLAAFKSDLPFSPLLLEQIFAQTGDNSTSPLEEIAETIERDQGLTARVLRTANSAFYGLQSQVATIPRALAVLGMHEVKAIAAAVGVAALGRGRRLPEGFDLGEYWGHQLRVGMAASHLAAKAGLADADDLFTCGLLHDLGKLLTAIHSPKDWEAVDRLRREARLPYHEAEDEHWSLEHGVVGAMTLKSWNLPTELTEPINWHHAPMLAPECRKEAVILCLADALVLHLTDPDQPQSCDWRAILDKLHLDAATELAALEQLFAGKDFENFAASLK